MRRNYLEALAEQMKEPEFKAELEALHAEGESVEIQIDSDLLSQLQVILNPMGLTPEHLVQGFFSWCVDPNTQQNALVWMLQEISPEEYCPCCKGQLEVKAVYLLKVEGCDVLAQCRGCHRSWRWKRDPAGNTTPIEEHFWG